MQSQPVVEYEPVRSACLVVFDPNRACIVCLAPNADGPRQPGADSWLVLASVSQLDRRILRSWIEGNVATFDRLHIYFAGDRWDPRVQSLVERLVADLFHRVSQHQLAAQLETVFGSDPDAKLVRIFSARSPLRCLETLIENAQNRARMTVDDAMILAWCRTQALLLRDRANDFLRAG